MDSALRSWRPMQKHDFKWLQTKNVSGILASSVQRRHMGCPILRQPILPFCPSTNVFVRHGLGDLRFEKVKHLLHCGWVHGDSKVAEGLLPLQILVSRCVPCPKTKPPGHRGATTTLPLLREAPAPLPGTWWEGPTSASMDGTKADDGEK